MFREHVEDCGFHKIRLVFFAILSYVYKLDSPLSEIWAKRNRDGRNLSKMALGWARMATLAP